MRVERAFRWRHGPCSADDFIAVHDGRVVLAIGYEHGFSTGWPKGSRALLDLAATRDVRATRDAYLAQIEALLGGEPDFDVGGPGGSLLVAELRPGTLRLEWLGELGALVVRDGDVVARARPHTLRERIHDFHPDATAEQIAAVPDVVTASIAAGLDAPPESLAVETRPGDRIVLATANVLRAYDPPASLDGLVARAIGRSFAAAAAIDL